MQQIIFYFGRRYRQSDLHLLLCACGRMARFPAALLLAPILFAQAPAQGYVLDTGYPTLQAACAAAGTGTLMISKKWNLLATQSLTCNIQAIAGGALQPASGNTVTLAGSFGGDLTRHFDLSAGGHVNLSGATVATLYPQWFGALCGSADDTVAVQNTYNSIGPGQSVTHTCQSTISSMVYLPQSAEGAIVNGLGSSSIGEGANHGNLVSTAGSTLIASATASPFVMFDDYARGVTFNNFLVNGAGNTSARRGYVGTLCFVLASAQNSVLYNSGGQFCSSDGIDVDPLQTPLNTSLTTVSPSSYATISVAATQQAGIIMGTGNCLVFMLEPGTVRAEEVAYLRTNATTLGHLAITPVYTHTAPFPFQCNGSNNTMRLYNPVGTGNQGWGLDIHAQSDGNDIEIYSPQMTFNILGGELLAGSGLIQTGGHFEGNAGPGVQMGDLTGRRVVASTIGPPGDMENSSASFNVVVDLCGVLNQIIYRNASEYMPTTTTTTPAGCAATGGSIEDIGFGRNGNKFTNSGQLSARNSLGTLTLEPWTVSSQTGVPTGLGFTSTSTIGSLTIQSPGAGGYTNGDVVTITQSGATQGLAALTVTGGTVTAATPVRGSSGVGYRLATGLSVTGGSGSGLRLNITSITTEPLTVLTLYDSVTRNLVARSPQNTVTDNFHLQLAAGSASREAQLGVNTTTNHAVVQGTLGDSRPVALDLNPDGGEVNIGSSSQTTTLKGAQALPNIPASAGRGGLYVCVDSTGVLYKKSSCP